MAPTLSLVIAIASLAAWLVLIFVRHVPSGLPNGLYAVGILLLVRWIALRDMAGRRGA